MNLAVQDRDALVVRGRDRLRVICATFRIPAGADRSDLEQEAALRLLEAMDRWDPRQLSADRWMLGCCRRCVVEAARALWPPPGKAVRRHGQAVRARGALAGELGRDPTLAELAHYLGWSKARTENALVPPHQVCTADHLVDEVTPPASDQVEDQEQRRRLRAALEAVGATWLIDVFDDEGVTARAQALGVTERTVRRERARALARVRARLGET